MKVLVDDVGSFPLHHGISREAFARAYSRALKACAEGRNLSRDAELMENFYRPVAASLASKVSSGLDVVNYPQHYDMHKQFLEPITLYQEEPFLVQKNYAVIPELSVVEREASNYGKIRLKVCVTGPVELHLRTEFGYHIYEEILMNLAESVNRFLRNSMLTSEHVETVSVAIDEPSLGFADILNVEEEVLIEALESSVRGIRPRVQIHLHTLKAAHIPLEVEGVEILTGEFAATPKNMDILSKKILEKHDKYLRAGVSRTNIDSIIGELMEQGVKPSPEMLVEDEKIIRRRYGRVLKRYSDRVVFAGPDCGLGAWPSPEVAQLLLKRTTRAVKSFG
jgi:5-methyltetrahydropteroyltriglutamate--homocysteine methyltransferase